MDFTSPQKQIQKHHDAVKTVIEKAAARGITLEINGPHESEQNYNLTARGKTGRASSRAIPTTPALKLNLGKSSAVTTYLTSKNPTAKQIAALGEIMDLLEEGNSTTELAQHPGKTVLKIEHNFLSPEQARTEIGATKEKIREIRPSLGARIRGWLHL